MGATNTLQLAALGAGVAVVAVLAFRLTGAAGALASGAKDAAGAVVDGAANLLTSDNAITRNQANWDGDKTTAYQGAGVLGTLGAATNSLSGGAFASWGENLGGWFYDRTHADPVAMPATVNTGSISGGW